MGKTVVITTRWVANWPRCCVECLSTAKLASAKASVGRTISATPKSGGSLRIVGELTTLSYPVCQDHNWGLGVSNLFSRQSAGIIFLRVLSYISALIMVGLVLRFFQRLGSGEEDIFDPALLGFYMFSLVGSGIFILVVYSFFRTPVRIVGRDDDVMWVWFRSERYAEKFISVNPKSFVRTASRLEYLGGRVLQNSGLWWLLAIGVFVIVYLRLM